jgi:hypothetical protein
MSEAPISRRRWPRFSLRTLFVVVTVFGIWLAWNANRVRERNNLVEYLTSLEHQPNPVPTWVIRCEPSRLPTVWRLVGAVKPAWMTILLCNHALTDDELARAKSLLPDCEIEVVETF